MEPLIQLLTIIFLAFPTPADTPGCYDHGLKSNCSTGHCYIDHNGFSTCYRTITYEHKYPNETVEAVEFPRQDTLECHVTGSLVHGQPNLCSCRVAEKCSNQVDQKVYDIICTGDNKWKNYRDKPIPICKRKLTKCVKDWSGSTETCSAYDQACILQYPEGPSGCGPTDYISKEIIERRTTCTHQKCYCNCSVCETK